MKLMVTGGAGFIGGNFIRYILNIYPDYQVVNYDKLTYAGHLSSLSDLELNPNYKFIKGDIADRDRVEAVLKKNEITHVVNFAAETHVDRSIENPQEFLLTNVLGTQALLDASLKCGVERFHHVSTDEVFGELSLNGKDKFTESTIYDPRSPYSASKAASDHLVRAYASTHGLNITISNASNNFGPYCDAEKFIPRAITNLIDGKKIPIYGDGKYVRDWLNVSDHCRAIDTILHSGKSGETYLVGGDNHKTNNLDIARMLLKIFGRDESYIEFVTDRKGHDRRYAIDFSKIKKELGWEPSKNFEGQLLETVNWYKANESWWREIKEESEKFYSETAEAKDVDKFKEYIKETSIPGLLVIDMPTYSDDRGFFREAVRLNVLEAINGLKFKAKQWNHARSKPGVIRALHAENWNKLTYPVTGKCFSALVDIRPDSPTFGKVETFNFDGKSHKALFIPKGVANSMCVTGNKAVEYFYLVDAYYNGKDTTAVAWDDPDLAIDWPIKKPIISDRDKSNPGLRELFPDKFKGK